MRSRIPFFVFIFTLTTIAIVLPAVVYAENVSIPFFGPIIPDSINRCAAGWGAVIDVINRIIVFLISLAIVFVAPIMIAYSGFLLVVNPVNPSGREKARGILKNTISGIVIALAAWMIVDAIMVVLYNPEASSGKTKLEAWANLVSSGGEPYCLIQESALQELNQALIYGSSATGDLTVVPPRTEPPSESAIRQQFENAGVSINHEVACNPYNIDGVVNGCTNVGNMRPATVAQVIAIKDECTECTVEITGGSEFGHASGNYSHGTGYKVDLGLNQKLNEYLKGMKQNGVRGGSEPGPIYIDRCEKNEYVLTSTHWDITIYSTCIPLK